MQPHLTIDGAHHRALIIGAGFGGLAVYRELLRVGVTDVRVLERADDVGGAWWVNTYPGCACDVKSNLYSLSWAPNPHWSRSYSPQAEIQRYLRHVSDEIGMTAATSFGTEVIESRWDAATSVWRVSTTRGEITADILVAATGALTVPTLPDIEGLAQFTGEVVHTAQWPADLNLQGRRVAVVGTGASAIQVVPGIVEDVAELTVFQRTPAWITPRGDRGFGARQEDLFRRAPLAQKAVRGLIYARNEALALGFTRRPELMDLFSRVAVKHLAAQVADPALRAELTPAYRFGCKRILSSDDFYPALQRPNARLISSALARVDGGTLISADGQSAEADLIVLATGFDVAEPPSAEGIFDDDGISLTARWQGAPNAYLGTVVSGFPNLFLITGPNTGLGHTSMVYIIESQARYIADAVRTMQSRGWRTIDVRPEVQEAFNAEVDELMQRTVWTNGSCQSWYQTPDGRVPTLWPGYTFQFRRRTRRFDPASYRVTTGVKVSA
ncbi:MAG: NAD(P)/FAD-dependent oxidoreductase [Actinobacteria bacterium]|nr:NAD(P)/FAD-dependent oxidoreductase [Actinomycetota bacterium]